MGTLIIIGIIAVVLYSVLGPSATSDKETVNSLYKTDTDTIIGGLVEEPVSSGKSDQTTAAGVYDAPPPVNTSVFVAEDSAPGPIGSDSVFEAGTRVNFANVETRD